MNIGNLKLSNDKPHHTIDRNANRRLRLSTSSLAQAKLAEQEAEGSTVKGRKWYWLEADGTYRASLKFGRQVLELEKGKFSVHCTNLNEVADAFLKLAEIVKSGHFDQQLDRCAQAIRKQFSKTKTE